MYFFNLSQCDNILYFMLTNQIINYSLEYVFLSFVTDKNQIFIKYVAHGLLFQLNNNFATTSYNHATTSLICWAIIVYSKISFLSDKESVFSP